MVKDTVVWDHFQECSKEGSSCSFSINTETGGNSWLCPEVTEGKKENLMDYFLDKNSDICLVLYVTLLKTEFVTLCTD